MSKSVPGRLTQTKGRCTVCSIERTRCSHATRSTRRLPQALTYLRNVEIDGECFPLAAAFEEDVSNLLSSIALAPVSQNSRLTPKVFFNRKHVLAGPAQRAEQHTHARERDAPTVAGDGIALLRAAVQTRQRLCRDSAGHGDHRGRAPGAATGSDEEGSVRQP